MTWLAAKLDKRIDICEPVQTPGADGGFSLSFTVICSIWANIAPIKNSPFMKFIRGMQVNRDSATHLITVRQCALRQIADRSSDRTLNALKGNYFLFLRQGNEEAASKGRRFAIKEIIDPKENGEYYICSVEELFEEGAAY